MNKWLVVEINFDGEKRLIGAEYDVKDDAMEVQEAMEWLHDENCYLIYTCDEWMYEVENGRA